MSSHNTLRLKVEYQDFREVYNRLRLSSRSVVGGRKYAFRSLLYTYQGILKEKLRRKFSYAHEFWLIRIGNEVSFAWEKK